MRVALLLGVLCALVGPWAPAQEAPVPEALPPQFFVSPTVGLDTNDGLSPEKPLQTVRAAIERAEPGSSVTLMAGWYSQPIVLKPGVRGKPIGLRTDYPERVIIGSLNPAQPMATGITLASYTHLDGLTIIRCADAAIRGEGVETAIISNCSLYGNGYAIFLKDSKNCRIGGNTIWGNRPPASPVAQVAFVGPTEAMRVDANRVFGGGKDVIGIFFMGGPHRDNILRRNTLWDTAGLLIQPLGENNVAEFNVCTGVFGADRLRHNTYAVPAGGSKPDASSDLVVSLLGKDPRFADPAWQDWRLQGDSPARGKGKAGTDLGALQYKGDVFYVKPDGSDAAEGTSLAAAWKTLRHAARALRAGQTLYILPGDYAEPLRLIDFTGGATTQVRAFGRGRVTVQRVEMVNCGNMEVGNLYVKGARAAGFDLFMCNGVRLVHCASWQNGGDGVLARRGSNLTLRHCALWRNSGSGLAAFHTAGVELYSSIVAENAQAQVHLGEDTDAYYGDLNALGGAVIGRVAARPEPITGLVQWQQIVGADGHSLGVVDPLPRAEQGDFRPDAGSGLRAAALFGKPVGPEALMAENRP